MIDLKQIPDEVVEAATLAIGEAISLWLHEHPGCVLEDVETHKLARAAITAALTAWSGFHVGAKATRAPYIILPLPTEARDE